VKHARTHPQLKLDALRVIAPLSRMMRFTAMLAQVHNQRENRENLTAKPR